MLARHSPRPGRYKRAGKCSVPAKWFYFEQSPCVLNMEEPSVVIEEVLGRSLQGKTQPFICRGDDGETYYVKGAWGGAMQPHL